MKPRPALLLAVLLYVSLDLALPMMPGVFVFSVADSVESIQTRARAATETVLVPTPGRDSLALSQAPRDTADRAAPAAWTGIDRRPAPISRSATVRDPAPPPEDPH